MWENGENIQIFVFMVEKKLMMMTIFFFYFWSTFSKGWVNHTHNLKVSKIIVTELHLINQ